uniref:HintN domain-containing protein n=1 Tax=Panagrellus redivivus TaxID=6233 RepID=A0A7E4UV96_PANRE
MKLTLLCVLISVPTIVYASFCGDAAVPFSFEALPAGEPVLGCARPSCFGWTADGLAAGNASSFYRVNRHADGYFRKSTESPKLLAGADAARFKPQTAKCSPTYDSEQCPKDTQWVGGLGPLLNASKLPLAIQCCEYEPLRLAEDRGVAVVKSGQIVIGGEVMNGKRQFAFDYISDVVKHTSESGEVTYDVSIKRFPCLPYPSEFAVDVDDAATDELLRRFANASRVQTNTAARALGSKTVVDSNVVETGPHILDSNYVQTQVQSQPIVADTYAQPQAQPESYVQPPVNNVEGPYLAEPTNNIEGPYTVEDLDAEIVDALPPGETAIQGVQLPEGIQPNIVGGGESSYYPVAQGWCAGGGYTCGFFCFAADTTVKMAGGGTKRMDELAINDWVLAADENTVNYARVYSWLHRMPKVTAEFIKFTLENGKELKMTSKHYIFRGKCEAVGKKAALTRMNEDMVYAEEVTLSDCLFVHVTGSKFVETRISKIETVTEEGIYAPMTGNGNIVVNDIFASCFNVFSNKEMQLSFADNLRWYAESLWGRLFAGEAPKDVAEIELIPGMSTLISILQLIVPQK